MLVLVYVEVREPRLKQSWVKSCFFCVLVATSIDSNVVFWLFFLCELQHYRNCLITIMPESSDCIVLV